MRRGAGGRVNGSGDEQQPKEILLFCELGQSGNLGSYGKKGRN